MHGCGGGLFGFPGSPQSMQIVSPPPVKSSTLVNSFPLNQSEMSSLTFKVDWIKA